MIGVIIGSRKIGINPDNVATPIAASLGDLITLALLSGISWGLYLELSESVVRGRGPQVDPLGGIWRDGVTLQEYNNFCVLNCFNLVCLNQSERDEAKKVSSQNQAGSRGRGKSTRNILLLGPVDPCFPWKGLWRA